jgi:hypothetical protein
MPVKHSSYEYSGRTNITIAELLQIILLETGKRFNQRKQGDAYNAILKH